MNASVCLSQSKTREPGKGFNPSKLTKANRLRELLPIAGRVPGDKYQIQGNVYSRATAIVIVPKLCLVLLVGWLCNWMAHTLRSFKNISSHHP